MDAAASPEDAGFLIFGVLGCFATVAVPILFIFCLIMAIVRKSKGWTVATIVMGVLGLGAVIAAVAFSANQVAEAVEESKIPREFADDEGRFALTGPGSWSVQDLGHPDAELEIGNLFAEEYVMVISEAKSEFDEDFSLDDFADIAGGAMIDVLGDPDYSEFEELTVNGMPARRHRLNGTIDGIRIAYVNTFVEGKEDFHQVLAWTLEVKQDLAIEKLQEAANSFRESSN